MKIILHLIGSEGLKLKMPALTINLKRQSNEPWGFNLSGGKDQGSPITISEVNQHFRDFMSNIFLFCQTVVTRKDSEAHLKK